MSRNEMVPCPACLGEGEYVCRCCDVFRPCPVCQGIGCIDGSPSLV